MGKKNYELTDQDRFDIAELALTGLDMSEEIKSTLARSFVSKSFFNERIGMLTQFVNANKGRIVSAGISGKEMIQEISKVLGTDWQTQTTSTPPSTVVNVQTENYILAADDQTVEMNNGGNDRSLTIPLQSSVAFTAGRLYEFRKLGTGDIDVLKGGSMIFRTGLTPSDSEFKIDGIDVFSVFAENIAPDVWRFTGSLKAA